MVLDPGVDLELRSGGWNSRVHGVTLHLNLSAYMRCFAIARKVPEAGSQLHRAGPGHLHFVSRCFTKLRSGLQALGSMHPSLLPGVLDEVP